MTETCQSPLQCKMSVEEDTVEVENVVPGGGSATLIIEWLIPLFVVVGVFVLLGWCCSSNRGTSSGGKIAKGSPVSRERVELPVELPG